VKFINGKANAEDWVPSETVGKCGSCCTEIDLWEASKMATASTRHSCSRENRLAATVLIVVTMEGTASRASG